jgi:hypothetical protein
MEIWWEGVDLIHLAEDRDKWRAIMDTVINGGVPEEFVDWLSDYQILKKYSAT